jgi:hypothetical protein
VTDQFGLLLLGALVSSVSREGSALRVGFKGRHHLLVNGAWRVEAAGAADAEAESIGVLIGQTAQSATVDARELALTFSRHRIVVLVSRDEAWNAANHLAILYEADYPALTW